MYRLNLTQAPLEVYEPFNVKLLKLWIEKDALELSCEQTQENDQEITEELERESRMTGGEIAGNMADLNYALAGESRSRREIASLEKQVFHAKSICDAEATHQDHTKDMHSNDDETRESLEKMNEDCAAGKIPEGGLTCAELKAKLDAMSKHLADQKHTKIAEHKENIENCEATQQRLNARIKTVEDQRAQYNEDVVRYQNIETDLHAERKAITERLDRIRSDAEKTKVTCDDKIEKYKRDMETLKEERQKAAEKAAGERVVAPLDCKVSDWRYEDCSKKCKKDANDSPGTMKATRSVNSPPFFGGMDCPELSESFPCNDHPCPIDCEVSEWTSWSACSEPCGYGTRTKSRKVLVEPNDTGQWCPSLLQRQLCNIHACGNKCDFSQWTSWSSCSRKCRFNEGIAAGQQVRIRRAFGNTCPAADHKERLQSKSCNADKMCKGRMTCNASQDVLFLVDASGDPGEMYADQIKAISNIAKESSGEVKFGVVSFGKEMKILSPITANRASLASVANYEPPKDGSRDAAEAMMTGATLFSSLDVDWDRQRSVVLFLGGDVAGRSGMKNAADELKAADVRVIVVLAHGGNALAENYACELASYPCAGNVEYIESWNDAINADRLLPTICSGTVEPKTDDPNTIDWKAQMNDRLMTQD